MNDNTQRFTLIEEHVKLARAMQVGWQDVEFGAPEIDPKRPYGNSDVLTDIAEELGWDSEINEDGELSEQAAERARKLHEEMWIALQVILASGSFTPGEYEAPEYTSRWTLTDG